VKLILKVLRAKCAVQHTWISVTCSVFALSTEDNAGKPFSLKTWPLSKLYFLKPTGYVMHHQV